MADDDPDTTSKRDEILLGIDRAYVQRVVDSSRNEQYPQINRGVLVSLLAAIDAKRPARDESREAHTLREHAAIVDALRTEEWSRDATVQALTDVALVLRRTACKLDGYASARTERPAGDALALLRETRPLFAAFPTLATYLPRIDAALAAAERSQDATKSQLAAAPVRRFGAAKESVLYYDDSDEPAVGDEDEEDALGNTDFIGEPAARDQILRAAIVKARKAIDDASSHEDPMCEVVRILDDALVAADRPAETVEDQ